MVRLSVGAVLSVNLITGVVFNNSESDGTVESVSFMVNTGRNTVEVSVGAVESVREM